MSTTKTIYYGLVANKLDLYNMHTVKMQEHTMVFFPIKFYFFFY